MIARKYGVVYTPDRLADFAAELLCAEIEKSEFDSVNVLDPACGECALLDSVKKIKRNEYEYIGIDVDKSAILSASSEYTIINNDTILPKNVRKRTAEFWTGKLPTINAVIANPPWSSEKIYNRDDLRKAGYELTAGQYDSFVLFLELAYKIVCENGIFAFIIPDSIFDSQNENLRRFLIRNTEIKVIARLGEKLFDEVNRATTIIVCKKRKPNEQSITKCFRLSTNDRKRYLLSDIKLIDIYKENVHQVLQRRFLENPSCNFDVDTRREEENLIAKIKSSSITWEDKFNFGRGVEISKSGKVVFCSKCGCAQGYKKSQFEKGEKTCTYCGEKIIVSDKTIKSVISKDANGDYTSEGNFEGIIDNLVIWIIKTSNKKYYAGFIDIDTMPDEWPHDIGLEEIFKGDRRGVIDTEPFRLQFVDDKECPFGDYSIMGLEEERITLGNCLYPNKMIVADKESFIKAISSEV